MLDFLVDKPTRRTIRLHAVPPRAWKRWLQRQPKRTRNWVAATGYRARVGKSCVIPAADGTIASAVIAHDDTPWGWASLPTALPPGRYRVEGTLKPAEADRLALGWALGCYEFTHYRAARKKPASLVWPEGCNRARVERLVGAIGLARDLINTPASDMGPAEIATTARRIGAPYKARVSVLKGQRLLEAGYPSVFAVGKGSARPPHLVDLRWGKPDDPRVTLVGKGVCFDSGGLNIKSTSGMKLMKKDMGGAAAVLGLAQAIMDGGLRVRLRVLVPAVENAVSGDSYRPLDVLATRQGKTVEVGNTDAEGRLVMSDALTEGAAESPDLLIDIATLTGAARIALGTELPALFTHDEQLAGETLAAGTAETDPLWRMPLFEPYRAKLDSRVADLNNVSSGPYGGAITAALFLNEFVPRGVPWMHIDTMGWNLESRPGRPQGGEAFGLRALYALLENRYGANR